MLVYIVFEFEDFDGYERIPYVNKVFADAQNASDYCKEMSKKVWGVHYEYESYKVH